MSSPIDFERLNDVIQIEGKVKHGFGRGSKLLGFPTANVDIQDSPGMDQAEMGVYFGWGQLENGPLIKAVISVGWNPTFKDLKTKALEVYFVHDFPEDFYGRVIRVLVLGYIRPMLPFVDLDQLILAIKRDVEISSQALDSDQFASVKQSSFFSFTH